MPMAPPKPCRTCGRLLYGGAPCPDHRRPSSYARGYTREWSAYSQRFLGVHKYCGDRGPSAPATDHSRCRAQGLQVLANVTDHIEPHRGDPGLMWSPANHQALCSTCHNRKTATEDSGFAQR